ncbi:MAG: GCN5-related N-acetyltransferase [Hyphomonadaceae bacterium]|nr:MAG: GCN5-related N-acetyltransferase [Hyphomonadaceae bacterium]KAF0186840.1 MAG: GCN5-related N-acetyltransferase [Hyphomonadaceae bacterium]
MKNILLRTAEIEDADELGSLHVRTWQETYTGLLPNEFLEKTTINSRVEMWQRVLSQMETLGVVSVVVAQGAEGIIGFASSSKQRNIDLVEMGYLGEIGAIYVLNSFQNKGIGSALMREMARALSERKLNSASLWVLEDNSPALRFYEYHGAKPLNLSKPFTDGSSIREMAYGWRDLAPLIY